MCRIACIGRGAILALSFLGLRAFSQDLSILYHESLDLAGLGSASAGISAKPEPGAGLSDLSELSFPAFGRQFELDLWPNGRLIGDLPFAQKRLVENLALYAGTVRNAPGSWVRVSVIDGHVTGAIWDGAELYIIDRRSDIAALLVSPEAEPQSEAVIYRWSDTVGTVSDLVVTQKRESPTLMAAISEPGSTISQAPLLSPLQQVDIGIIGDSALTPENHTASALLGRMNVVDGIFLSQLGVYLNITEIVVYDSSADPFTSSVGSELLAELETHKNATPALQNLPLAHLFTGRDLESGTGESDLAGIANLGVLCDNFFGVGISELRTGIASGLVAAHEIGHNFGAPHDNESGSVCEATAGDFLMSPDIGGDTLSQCSIDQIEIELAAAACLADIPPGDLSLRSIDSITSVLRRERFDIVFAVDNLGTDDALLPEFTIDVDNLTPSGILTVPPADERVPWDCDDQALPYRCWRNTMPAGVSDTFELSLRALDDGTGGTVTIEISSANDSVPGNDLLVRNIEVAPDVELRSNINILEDVQPGLRPFDEVTVRATTGNTGDDIATGIEMAIVLPEFLEVLSVSPSAGTCSMGVDVRHQTCSVGSLAYNEDAYVDISVRALQLIHQDAVWREGELFVEASAIEREQDIGNNSDVQTIPISDRYVTLWSNFSIPDEIEAGTEASFELTMNNTGPEDATSITVEFRYADYELSGVIPPTGGVSCQHDALESLISCELGDLSVDEEISFSWQGTVGTQSSLEGYVGVNMRVIPREFNLNGNIQEFDYMSYVTPSTVVPEPEPEPEPPPPSGGGSGSGGSSGGGSSGGGGGGGGAMSPLLLLLLLGWRQLRLLPRNRLSRVGVA